MLLRLDYIHLLYIMEKLKSQAVHVKVFNQQKS
jgi:hypothetical protein